MNPFSLQHITGAEGYAMAAAGDLDPAALALAADDTGAEETAATTGQFSMQNIADADGYSIALSGLAIVFFALVVVTVFISILPRALAILATVWPEEMTVPEATTSAAASGADDGVIAAIGYMMHARQQGGSDK